MSIKFPFFSLFDPRLRPAGSRDPLGIEVVWGYLGRQLVGNLTTVTGDLDNFYVALLACHSTQCSPAESVQLRHEYFIRMEQLFAYLRITAADKGMHPVGVLLGVTEARKRIQSDGDTISLGLGYPLLAGPLRAGLWGLYTPALERSGLLSGRERKLSASGLQLVQRLVDQGLGEHWDALCNICYSGQVSTRDRERLALPVTKLLENIDLRQHMVKALLCNNEAGVFQSALYDQAELFLRHWNGEGNRTRAFLVWLKDQNQQRELAVFADQILRVEPLLVIINRVFRWLQSCHDRHLVRLKVELKQALEGVSLNEAILSGVPHGQFLAEVYEHLKDNNAEALMHSLLAQNKKLIQARGGASWMEFRADGEEDKLHVRMVDNSIRLPEKGFAAQNHVMDNNYFLYSFLTIASTLKVREAKA